MLDHVKAVLRIWSLSLLVVYSLVLAACGGGSTGDTTPTDPTPPSQPGTTLTGRPLAEQALRSVLEAPGIATNAQVYAMVLVAGDLITTDPNAPLTGTRSCLNGGTNLMVLNDVNGDQQISSGESAEVTLTNCFGSASRPGNGMLHQDLISFDAVFPPGSIFASTINAWNATYTYTNFTRIDAYDGMHYAYNGDLTFDYKLLGSAANDFELTLSSKNLYLKADATELTLQDFTYAQRPAPTVSDTMDVSLTGTILEPHVGKMEVSSGVLTLNAVSSDQPYFTGFVTIKNGIVTIDFTFNSDGSVTAYMDGDTWMFTP